MQAWAAFAVVGAGGALGAMTRYGLGLAIVAMGAPAFWATFAINVSGAFLIGVVAELARTQMAAGTPMETLRLFLAVGILGGYTTFSSFSLETLQLLRGGSLVTAILYPLVSVVLGVLAAFAGIALVARLQGAAV